MNKLKIKGIYKHFKGDYYIVEDIAIDSETNKELVIYRSLYGKSTLFARSKKSFLSKVDKKKYPEIKQKYRFELQTISSKNR